jgi:hypothetical protein
LPAPYKAANPITAGSTINITSDDVAVNAMLDAGFSVTLAPRSAGRPVSVGLETGGAFSVTQSELALIDTTQVTLGSNSAGDLTVNAPIDAINFESLVLRSGGDVTQTPGSTITVRVVETTDPLTYAGSLSVFSGGAITLPEANDIAVSVSGSASGVATDFVFNNVSPLRLQNVTGVFASGRVLLRSATSTSSPAAPQAIINAALADILKAQNNENQADKRADETKDQNEKKEREEDKKRGTQSCS